MARLTPILDREVIQDNDATLWEDIHALDYPATDADPNTVWTFATADRLDALLFVGLVWAAQRHVGEFNA